MAAQALTALSFALNQLSTLIRDKAILLGGLRQEIQQITDQLLQMKAFLGVAEAREEEDPILEEYARQVQDVAYDIENVLDEFVHHFAPHHQHGICNVVGKTFALIKALPARHRIASQIQSIKSRITNIAECHQKFKFKDGIPDQKISDSAAVNNTWRYNRDDARLVEEAKLVGIDKPKQQLISQLLDSDINSPLKVVSVLGMGGIGKTTLVKKVNEDASVRKQFDILAWTTVSQSCDMMNLLQSLIQQLHSETGIPVPQQVASMDTFQLKVFIKNFLSDKSYLIVFDDVWDEQFWGVISFVFPEGNCGNRVMLTTRIADVASVACRAAHDYVHKMQPLSSEESWTLFCKRTYKDSRCPAHLNDVAEGILWKCEGLPLAIVTISGVLASIDESKVAEWKLIQRNLGGELEGSGKLDRLKKILSLSYNHLPSHLKTCLLYLSIFPEDYQIEDRRLIRLWMAEGFVQERTGSTVYEAARANLHDLTNRSLVQFTDEVDRGNPRYYRIHDLLRELILSKSTKQQFATTAAGQLMKWPEKVRRLAIHDFTGPTPKRTCFRHLRSLVTFNMPKSLLNELLCGGSRLLRVLDLQEAQIEEIPHEIFKFVYLRYLSLHKTSVKIIPKSIGNLKNLEILNLRDTKVDELPCEINKLKGLRHLLVFRADEDVQIETKGFKAPNEFGRLISLEFLSYVEANSNGKLVGEIGELKQLKTLGITKLRRKDGEKLCSSLEKLTSLEKLFVHAVRDEVVDLHYLNDSLSSSLQNLHLLCLGGRLEKLPEFMCSLQGLTYIELRHSRLEDDPLESLQHLPNLQSLYLHRAYQGEGLSFKAGYFLKLQHLVLVSLPNLRWLEMEKGVMPNLRELDMKYLLSLEGFPCGIQHLTELQFLFLGYLNENLAAVLENQDEESEDYNNISKIPEIYIWKRDERGIFRHVLYDKRTNK